MGPKFLISRGQGPHLLKVMKLLEHMQYTSRAGSLHSNCLTDVPFKQPSTPTELPFPAEVISPRTGETRAVAEMAQQQAWSYHLLFR